MKQGGRLYRGGGACVDGGDVRGSELKFIDLQTASVTRSGYAERGEIIRGRTYGG